MHAQGACQTHHQPANPLPAGPVLLLQLRLGRDEGTMRDAEHPALSLATLSIGAGLPRKKEARESAPGRSITSTTTTYNPRLTEAAGNVAVFGRSNSWLYALASYAPRAKLAAMKGLTPSVEFVLSKAQPKIPPPRTGLLHPRCVGCMAVRRMTLKMLHKFCTTVTSQTLWAYGQDQEPSLPQQYLKAGS